MLELGRALLLPGVRLTIRLRVNHQGWDALIVIAVGLHLGTSPLAECLKREAVVASVSLALRDGRIDVAVGMTYRLSHGAALCQRSERFDI
jgi:hypothetical protein